MFPATCPAAVTTLAAIATWVARDAVAASTGPTHKRIPGAASMATPAASGHDNTNGVAGAGQQCHGQFLSVPAGVDPRRARNERSGDAGHHGIGPVSELGGHLHGRHRHGSEDRTHDDAVHQRIDGRDGAEQDHLRCVRQHLAQITG